MGEKFGMPNQEGGGSLPPAEKEPMEEKSSMEIEKVNTMTQEVAKDMQKNPEAMAAFLKIHEAINMMGESSLYGASGPERIRALEAMATLFGEMAERLAPGQGPKHFSSGWQSVAYRNDVLFKNVLPAFEEALRADWKLSERNPTTPELRNDSMIHGLESREEKVKYAKKIGYQVMMRHDQQAQRIDVQIRRRDNSFVDSFTCSPDESSRILGRKV